VSDIMIVIKKCLVRHMSVFVKILKMW